MKKKIIWGIFAALLIGLLVAQIFPPKNIDGPFDPKMDISKDSSVPIEVAAALKTSCYDCHSYQPHYPWYANIGAVKYYLNGHIKGASEHLNFSRWKGYPEKDRGHLMEEICEQIEEGNMPLWNYALAHKDILLTEQQKKQICQWVKDN